ncbi:MAG: hypothetical protein NC906_00600 [Candidatus Omnitrophica bacterium]|nr:hypothetical protein [Candidatus Omnitrophota bacterium]
MNKRNLEILRNLAKRYIEICNDPVMDERRRMWTKKNSLKLIEPLIFVSFGMHNVWCREVFGDHTLECEDAFLRVYERQLKMYLFHYEIGDDWIAEPFLSVRAVFTQDTWDGLWGLPASFVGPVEEGGAGRYEAAMKDWSMMGLLKTPKHEIDEEKTRENFNILNDAIGDIIPIAVDRGPVCLGFSMDISTHLGKLRGHQQLMLDMYDAPEQLHRLLAFMRDGILENQRQAEEKGDITLLNHVNQAMPYCEELEPPAPNSGPKKRSQIWGYSAAQEYTLISPAMHDEFLLQYQIPILKNFGLTAYGCCENLTEKIDILRKIPNLRIIAVTPTADVHRCAAQIGKDYVLSWRPNPADMVCYGFDESRIKKIVSDAMKSLKNCYTIIVLKDIETVQREPERLKKWVSLVRSIVQS